MHLTKLTDTPPQAPSPPKEVLVLGLITLILLITSCTPISGFRSLAEIDIIPPLLIETATFDAQEFHLTFTEDITPIPAAFWIEPAIPIADIAPSKEDPATLILTTATPVAPGTRIVICGSARDLSGNSVDIRAGLYGWNPHIPRLIITEFTTRGSGKNPDRVELFVEGSGNLAGVTLLDGTRTQYRQRVILPPIAVEPGDYVIIHFQPDPADPGLCEDEVSSPGTAAVATATQGGYDIWARDTQGAPTSLGLSGNNGCLTLRASPFGPLIDGVVYSNRTSASDERYRGFGSTDMMGWVDDLQQEGGWETPSVHPGEEIGRPLSPEDCVDSTYTTATRSISRALVGKDGDDSEGYADTNTAGDWHVVPTGGQSFGYVNDPSVHVP